MDKEKLEALQKQFPHWKSQSELLLQLFRHQGAKVFIPGPPDPDKSIFLQELLSTLSLRVAFVRGSDTSWNRELFFTSLLNQLADATIPEPHAPVSHSSATAKLTKSYATLSSAKMRRTCQSTDVFIESLKALLFRSASTVRACIMVDDVQNFSADLFGETFVSVLLRLDELTSLSISVILISSCDWSEIQPEFPVQTPIIVHLPAPSKAQLISILKNCPYEFNASCQERIRASVANHPSVAKMIQTAQYFAHLLIPLAVNALHIAFPTKHEMLIIITALLPYYVEPYLNALERRRQPPSPAILYSHISPLFQVVVQSPSIMMVSEELELASRGGYANRLDFPLITKYLILAGWIAARNPNVDERIKDRRRRRKSTKRTEAARLEQEAFAPPSSWRLPKLLSILDHILEGNEEIEESDTAASSAPLDQETAALFSSVRQQVAQLQQTMELEAQQVKDGNMQLDITESTQDVATTTMEALSIDPIATPSSLASLEDSNESQAAWDLISFDGEVNPIDKLELDCELALLLGQPNEPPPPLPPLLNYEPKFKNVHTPSLFPLLWQANESNPSQVEILLQIGVLERVGLFIRIAKDSSKSGRARSEYRCGYAQSFAMKIADSINFPLWGFL